MSNEINYCFYGVAFMDVLGQKEAFEDISDFPVPGDTEDDFKLKLVEAHKKTAHFINQFREWFKGYFDAYTKIGASEQAVPSDKRQQYKEMSKCDLRLVSFSDCIQSYTPLRTDKYHCNAVNGIYGMLSACGSMLLLALSYKKAVRGGIDIGWGTELPSGEVYGPALYRAYQLESKTAQYPRVVIGEALVKYLKELAVRNTQMPDQTKEDVDLCQSLAVRCLKMIAQDLDGYAIIDYLGQEFRRFEKNLSGDETNSYKEVSKRAFEFVKSEFVKWQKTKNQRLAIRYHQLLSYFQSRGVGVV